VGGDLHSGDDRRAPVYYFNVTGFAGNKADGPDEVHAIYRMLAETGAGVQVVEDERLMVSDWGFASEAVFNSYYRGHTLIEVGVPVDDPMLLHHAAEVRDAVALRRARPDDRRAGLREQGLLRADPDPADDFLTIEDARARLLPMLRPLPVFEPDTALTHG